jgi:serine/threonine protein kinase
MINDRYKIIKMLGEGRSKVFLCEDTGILGSSKTNYQISKKTPQNKIAIKILPENVDNEELDFFKNEFFILQWLNHPSIVKSFELGTIVKLDNEDEISIGRKFFTMEFCQGERLLFCDELKDETFLIKVITKLCSVLFYLHQSNYIYYDLKPDNILVSVKDGEPIIKLIDLGLAQHILFSKNNSIRGSAEYIAPEILRNEKHDFRIDFYSLGMLLYRILYGKFPFPSDNALEIYKAHLESEYIYPLCNYSEKIVGLVKKLLAKNPADRFESAIQILNYLEIPLTESLYKDWLPAKTFADRQNYINILKKFITDNSEGEVFTLHGSEGAGKTAIAYQIYSMFGDVILITNRDALSGIDFFRSIVKQIVFNNVVYSKLSQELLNQINKMLNEEVKDLANEAKSIFNNLTSLTHFTIIFDAFNHYDEFTLNILSGIIPILQVNKINIILTENSDRQFASGSINNLLTLDVSPFTETDLTEYLDSSFSSLFPKEKLKQLLLTYADLLPGSIENFMKDLILLKVLRYTPDGVIIQHDEKTDKLLRISHESIYSMRLQKLNKDELSIARLLSSLEISLDAQSLCKLEEISSEEMDNIFSSLTRKNILQRIEYNSTPVFTSEGLKKYIYSSINEKLQYHSALANKIKEKLPDFNKNELARQLELSKRYAECLEILKEEIKEADKQSAFSYKKRLLEHLINLPLKEEQIFELKYELISTFYNLSDYLSMNSIIDELLSKTTEEKIITDLQIQKGFCLIELGEYTEGKSLLQKIQIENPNHIQYYHILYNIALAEYNLNNYDVSMEICNKIINDSSSSDEEKAEALEILGLNYLKKDTNLNKALECFENAIQFSKKLNKKNNLALMLLNKGTVYDFMGKWEKSIKFWEEALDISHSVGNIELEAKLLGSFGLVHINKLNFNNSVEDLEKGKNIFKTIGNKKWEGKFCTILGEICFIRGDYQQAIDNFVLALNLFRTQQNLAEEFEAYYGLKKIYFQIGDTQKFFSLDYRFNRTLKFNSTNTELSYLGEIIKILISLQSRSIRISKIKIATICEHLISYNRKFDFLLLISNLVLSFIERNLYDKAYQILLQGDFIKQFDDNLLFLAEKNYLLGKLSLSYSSNELKPPINYFEEAYKILENIHVMELTWKVLYEMSKYYFGRGQKSKARNYAADSISLIEYFGQNIKDQSLKDAYFNKPERKNALEKLNSILL